MWQFLSFAKEKIDCNKEYYIINPVLKSINNFIFDNFTLKMSKKGLNKKVSCVLSVFRNCFIKIFPEIISEDFDQIYSIFEFLKNNLNLEENQFLGDCNNLSKLLKTHFTYNPFFKK
jgi:hypothetical protein